MLSHRLRVRTRLRKLFRAKIKAGGNNYDFNPWEKKKRDASRIYEIATRNCNFAKFPPSSGFSLLTAICARVIRALVGDKDISASDECWYSREIRKPPFVFRIGQLPGDYSTEKYRWTVLAQTNLMIPLIRKLKSSARKVPFSAPEKLIESY